MVDVEAGAGLVFRYHDEHNFWAVTAEPDEGAWSGSLASWMARSRAIGDIQAGTADGTTISVSLRPTRVSSSSWRGVVKGQFEDEALGTASARPHRPAGGRRRRPGGTASIVGALPVEVDETSASHDTGRLSARMTSPSRRACSPALDEADNLVGQLLPELAAGLSGVFPVWAIVVVDDGSTDDTPAVLAPVGAASIGPVVVRLRRNSGKSPALRAGLRTA